MAKNDVTEVPKDSTVNEHPFVRYVRATLSAALKEQKKSFITLGSISIRDNLKLSPAIIHAYQWQLLHCRARQELTEVKQKSRRGLLCIGEVVGPDLRDTMLSAGIGTVFTIYGKSVYRRNEALNRSEQVFDPAASPILCEYTVMPSKSQPDWSTLEEQMKSHFVTAALRHSE